MTEAERAIEWLWLRFDEMRRTGVAGQPTVTVRRPLISLIDDHKHTCGLCVWGTKEKATWRWWWDESWDATSPAPESPLSG